ncbi:MAG: sporulation protein YtxC [Eubacteriales bacterium]|nr:sporulation protein YtxC [Eubacteriales bacterium]
MYDRVCAVRTQQYEADIGKLMRRRLAAEEHEPQILSSDKKSIEIRLKKPAHTESWLSAVSGLLLYDLSHLELAVRIDALPVNLREKQWILSKAAKLSRGLEKRAVQGELAAFFTETDALNLEGFVRFRMQNVQLAWDACVRQATEELLLEKEYRKLIGILSAFVRMQKPRIDCIYIILNPDGSCTLTDDMDMRVRYACDKGDGVVSLLVGLAPERITVYDLSGGRSDMLTDVLLRVFEDRVKYFK